MNLTILTGAGISVESGLETFRAKNGLWAGSKLEEVCTPEAFARDPDRVCQFYDERKRLAAQCMPNKAHEALAELEQHWREHSLGDFLLITQNVDDLHERAGSKNLIHVHGELNSTFCVDCGYQGPRYGSLENNRECPSCQRDSLRPDIVFFGEAPRRLLKIEEALHSCDVFVAIGTSGQVYPAASFVHLAKLHGAKTVLLNFELHDEEVHFDLCTIGRATTVVPQWSAAIIVEAGQLV